jgi:hypothetical protein
MLSSLLNTLVNSTAQQAMLLPNEVEGFTSVPVEYVE